MNPMWYYVSDIRTLCDAGLTKSAKQRVKTMSTIISPVVTAALTSYQINKVKSENNVDEYKADA